MEKISYLATFLRKRRRELDLTQKNVAEKLSISIGSISNMETGRSSINFKKLGELLEFLNIELRIKE